MASIFFSEPGVGRIRELDTITTGLDQVDQGVTTILDSPVDYTPFGVVATNSKVFFVSSLPQPGLYSIPQAGGSVTTLRQTGFSELRGLAASNPSGSSGDPDFLIYADIQSNTIIRYDTNADVEETIVKLHAKSGDYLASLDADNSHVYFADYRRPAIFRVDIDGTSIEEIVPGRINRPSGALAGQQVASRAQLRDDDFFPFVGGHIRIDTAGSKLYWSTPAEGLIERADLDGSNREVFIDTLPESAIPPMARIGSDLYWIEHSRVKRKPVAGGAETVEAFLDQDDEVFGLTVV